MKKISKEEKEEFLKTAKSVSLRSDMRKIKDCRYNWLLGENAEPSLDRLNSFLTQYNAFMGHRQRRFKRIKADNIIM